MSDSCMEGGLSELIMRTTFTSHANKGDELLTLAKINELADAVFAANAEGVANRIAQKGCEDWFRKHIPKTMEPSPVSVFYGLPIYSDPRVPFGEFWVLDSKDNVIRRFKTL